MSGQLMRTLRLSNVRSYDTGSFEFHKNVNAIVGPNGSGKTTILEAIYVLARGKSFRGSMSEIVKWGEQQTIVDLGLRLNGEEVNRRLTSMSFEGSATQKKWDVSGKKSARLSAVDRLPIVLFEPDIGRMITGSPERRRQYIDNLAGQIDFEVASSQTRFERILKQRNALLKKMAPHSQTKLELDQLFIWNTQLADLSKTIVGARLSVIKQLQAQIIKQYKKLGGSDAILLAYQTNVTTNHESYASKLLQFLESSLTRDIVLGHTSFGPHRDDLEIRLADQPARERASRGEIRTIVLAMKLLEAEILRKEYSEKNIRPTLLFDDVLSELDLNHQEQILAGFKDYQVFITTTDAHTLTPGTYTIALD
jgi:DNA replication and repair protein RecF